jgi:lysophospholipase L1-like esterase
MNKKIVGVIFLICFQHLLNAQVSLPSYPDFLFSTYYWQRVTHFNTLPQSKDDIIFLGNSITDGAEWAELFQDDKIKNRGISGDITAGVIHRLNKITEGHPSEIFLLIGINDLARNIPVDSVVKNILIICSYVRQQSPSTRLFVQSILPVSDFYKKFPTHTDKGEQIKQVNEQLERRATEYHYHFIDLYSSFCDEEGKLRSNLTNDGLHLKGEAYLLWKHLIFPYIYGLQEKPSIIPFPQQLKWGNGYFKIYDCKKIIIPNDSLAHVANMLKQFIHDLGWQTEIAKWENNKEPVIELKVDAKNILPDEAYKLEVTQQKILISAKTVHGIFNGLQTLKQLMRDGVMVDACEIWDWPAYSWRGYMIDVGRNYMSLLLLKQQIEIMSRYKLNVFHFHCTEDIAWRLQSKLYPQLTAPENMLRNMGMYYTKDDLKELIAYCRERYITLVPEIDMPGHSAAFKRAMGVDMQSDSGLVIIKKLLNEFCSTYDLSYIHLGGDEVHVTNRKFMPAVISLLHGLGKTTIAWSPGTEVDTATIRQLWMSDNGEKNNSSVRCIDSRHLYINHMDPLESVVTIFSRQIGDTTKQTSNNIGATLCLWPDRRVENEDDELRMNPVYPSMLAFAERTWRGGGKKGWIANVSDGDIEAFKEFEGRLLDNKVLYFKDKPFPYIKQSNIKWKLYGPFNNDGHLTKTFTPDTKAWDESTAKIYKQVIGGTIVLRHWWGPLIKGAIDDPKENTTWYATTKIWSDEDAEKEFWIGFNNISRSAATDSPPLNAWDNKKSEVWVNGILVNPPHWKHAGQKGNSEVPLTDEGYEYRLPTKILLHKGWNSVLIKTPIGSFKETDWQNPTKWMYTFAVLGPEEGDN